MPASVKDLLAAANASSSRPGGKVLKDFGYPSVFNLGAFKDWAAGGGEVERV